jgi:hypothetical protein
LEKIDEKKIKIKETKNIDLLSTSSLEVNLEKTEKEKNEEKYPSKSASPSQNFLPTLSSCSSLLSLQQNITGLHYDSGKGFYVNEIFLLMIFFKQGMFVIGDPLENQDYKKNKKGKKKLLEINGSTNNDKDLNDENVDCMDMSKVIIKLIERKKLSVNGICFIICPYYFYRSSKGTWNY